jgi:hypothetical protein
LENRLLRWIFGAEKDEITWEWRRLHKEELNDLYCLPNIIWVIRSRRMEWTGHMARMGDRRDVYGVLVGKPEGKRPVAIARRRWDDNIKSDIQNVRWGHGLD